MASKRYYKAKLLFVLLLCLLSPTVSSGKMLVGVLFSGNIPYYRAMHVAFLDGLKQKLPEKDVKFILQFPAPDPVALSNSAKKLVVGGVDMIISYGYPATNAIVSKESDIPIVYIGVYDPESAINGRHVTGCSYSVPLSSLFDYYKKIMQIERLCVVYSSLEKDSLGQMQELVKLAEQEKIDLLSLDFRSRGDLKKLNDIGAGDAVFITGSSLAHVMIKDIMSLLEEKNVPAVDIFPDSSEEGILMTLHQNPEQQGSSAAEIAAKMIAGEQAADKIEPVVQRKTELVLNFIEAKKLGINFPPQLIGEATRVVE